MRSHVTKAWRVPQATLLLFIRICFSQTMAGRKSVQKQYAVGDGGESPQRKRGTAARSTGKKRSGRYWC
jgi:hypothetical protein